MATFTREEPATLTITVENLRALLATYDDNAVIAIEGGSDYGWEFVEVAINGEVIASA